MLSVLVVLLLKINSSNYKRLKHESSILRVTYDSLDLTDPIPNLTKRWSGYCYYLDYKDSLTLTLDAEVYKNPIIYCPRNDSTVKFEPTTGEVLYTPIFQLSPVFPFQTMYVSTKSFSTKSPSTKARVDAIDSEDFTGTLYADLMILPVDGASLSGGPYIDDDDDDHSIHYENGILVTYSINDKSYFSLKYDVSTSYATPQRQISKRYSIKFPSQGPFAMSMGSGLSTGAIIGIVVAVVVVVGVVGFCVYRFVLRKKV